MDTTSTIAQLEVKIAALEKELAKEKQINLDHAEDWAMSGIPLDSQLAKLLVKSDEVHKLTAELAAAKEKLRQYEYDSKDIKPREKQSHCVEIERAHPGINDNSTELDHERYAKAVQLVSERHDKYDLVNLVNWLLLRIEQTSEDLTTINQRDRAEDAANNLASAILGEDVDWPDHDAKWAEAFEAVITPAELSAVRAEIVTLKEALTDTLSIATMPSGSTGFPYGESGLLERLNSVAGIVGCGLSHVDTDYVGKTVVDTKWLADLTKDREQLNQTRLSLLEACHIAQDQLNHIIKHHTWKDSIGDAHHIIVSAIAAQKEGKTP